MVRGKEQLIFLLVLMLVGVARAEVNRYAVYFSDKNQNEFSIDKPEEFLSERSLARRNKHGVETSIMDLPVTSAYLEGVRGLGADVFFASRWFNAALVQCDDNLITSIKALTYVKEVQFMAPGSKLTKEISSVPTITSDVEPESLKLTTKDQLQMIGADNLHKDGYTGKGIFVAVFDAGFPGVNTSSGFKHIFDDNRLKHTWDFVSNDQHVYKSNSHGTQVLSCIGAKIQNKIVGTGYDADFALFITEDAGTENRIEEFNWLLAAELSDSLGVDVINSSLGYSTFDIDSMNYTYDDLNGDESLVTKAADLAASKGILVVTSAGNEGNKNWKHITVPADGDSVLTVGSVTVSRLFSSFSSIGPTSDSRIKPEVVALGQNVTVISSSGEIRTNTGTSFSSPIVAGFCASLMESKPELKVMEVINTLKASATRATEPNNQVGYGLPRYGIITASSVINFEDDIDVYPNPFDGDILYIKFNKNKPKGSFVLKVIDSKGNILKEQSFSSYKKKEVIELSVNIKDTGLYFLTLSSTKLNKKVKLIKF